MSNQNFFLRDQLKAKELRPNSQKKFSRKFDKIFLEIQKDVKDIKKTLNVLDKRFKFSFKVNDLKKFQNFKKVAIIGMGGSILGAEAIHHCFQSKIKKKFYFFNDLDEEKILNFKKTENLSKVLFLIISKSGNTLETLSNTFALNIFKRNLKNIILISEKKNNSLFLLAKKFNLFYVEHKNHIGGRYSVLSEVGLIPAFLMGINLSKLRSKILNCLSTNNKVLANNIIRFSILRGINELIYSNRQYPRTTRIKSFDSSRTILGDNNVEKQDMVQVYAADDRVMFNRLDCICACKSCQLKD